MRRKGVFRQLLGFPVTGLWTGKIHGVTVSRNPLAWIPFLLALPFALIAYLLVTVVGYPIFIVASYLGFRSLSRKRINFSSAGVSFPHAYRRLTIQWNDIREVVRYRDRIVIIYYIVTSIDGAPKNGFMAVTQQEEEFHQALESHNVPLRHRHFSLPDSELGTPL